MRFNYRHGMVSDIEFDSDDQVWSMNIKRSVVNMLQVSSISLITHMPFRST